MKVVVTGALGHIGSRLIRTMATAFPGSKIILIDNMAAQRYCSLFDLPHGADYQFVEADVTDADLRPYMEGADACIHLAAITDATSSFDNPKQVEEVNLVGTEQVAQACADTGVPLLFLSTTSVYGPRGPEVDETCSDEDLNPQSPYATSKLEAERRLEKISKIKSLRYVIFRFGTIFGVSPGMRFHTAVNRFCWLAAQGKPLTVWKTAYEQRRPYLGLDDAVNAIILALRQDLFDGRVYNVVTANLTVQDIVEAIIEKVGDAKMDFVETEIMNQHSYSVSNRRIEEKGFSATSDFRQDIHETLERLHGIRLDKEPKTILDARASREAPT